MDSRPRADLGLSNPAKPTLATMQVKATVDTGALLRQPSAAPTWARCG